MLQAGDAFYVNPPFGNWRSDVEHRVIELDLTSDRFVIVSRQSSSEGTTFDVLTIARSALASQFDSAQNGDMNFKVGIPDPHWAVGLEDAEVVPYLRASAETPHPRLVSRDKRVKALRPLLTRVEECFSEVDVKGAIRRLRASLQLRGTSGRAERDTQWVLRWLFEGREDNVFLGDYSSCGRICRLDMPDGAPPIKKDGRPIAHPDVEPTGYPMTKEMIEKSVRGYYRNRKKGASLSFIYDRTLLTEFDCRVVCLPSGKKHVIAPDGQPFPSFNQFKYHIAKELGKHRIKRDKFGDKHFDSAFATSIGSYAPGLRKLGERVEGDATQINENPVCVIDRRTCFKPLHEFRFIDAVTSDTLGIGFGTSESSEGYLMAKFCASVDKAYFCSLFGLAIADDRWKADGIWKGAITDRGSAPMSKINGEADLQEDGDFRQMAETGRGKSKPFAETSHDKTPLDEDGVPLRANKGRTIFEIIRSRLNQVITTRSTRNVVNRLTPEMLNAGVTPTPDELRKYLEAECNSSLRTISRREAIKRFVPKRTLTVHEDGVEYRGDRYWSNALPGSGLLELQKGRSYKHKGYAFSLIASTIWIDMGKDLEPLELKIQPALAGTEDQYSDLTDDDRDVRDGLKSKANARRNMKARTERAEQSFEEYRSEREAEQAKRAADDVDPVSAKQEAGFRGARTASSGRKGR